MQLILKGAKQEIQGSLKGRTVSLETSAISVASCYGVRFQVTLRKQFHCEIQRN